MSEKLRNATFSTTFAFTDEQFKQWEGLSDVQKKIVLNKVDAEATLTFYAEFGKAVERSIKSA